MRVVVAGHPGRLSAAIWPAEAEVVEAAGSTSSRFRGTAAVVDPVHDGVEQLRSRLVGAGD
jgi:hypothetical protein